MNISQPVTVIATSDSELDEFIKGADELGIKVKSSNIWSGPVPEGSYIDMGFGVRMASPEFMFLRKANELDEIDALMLGCELLSCYTTSLTSHLDEGKVAINDEPHTDLACLVAYLLQAAEYEEVMHALELLDKVPMTMPLYLMTIRHYEEV